MPLIYLDNAATTLHKPPEVWQAMQKALETCGGAGRGGHSAAQRAAETLYSCREEAAKLFHMSGTERVILTHNATHALNLAIKSLAKAGMTVVISGYEHNAVVRPLNALKYTGVRTVTVKTQLFDRDAVLRGFKDALGEDAGLCICTHMSNVFGFILPVEEIAAVCKEKGIPMIVDASQSAGLLPIQGDLYPYWCMPGHKSLYGPQGTGLLLVPPGGMLSPLMEGGTGGDSRRRAMPDYLPDRLEAGTHNAPGAAGLAAGLRFVQKNGYETSDSLLKKAVEAVSEIKGIRVFSGLSCQKALFSFTVDGKDSETAALALSDREIAVRGGLHCAPLAHRTAGTEEFGTVRAAFSYTNRERDVLALARALQAIVTNTKGG